MNFKLEELDGFDEEVLDSSDESSKDDAFSDEKEFDPLGFGDETDKEDSDQAVYESPEPEEAEEADDETDELEEDSSALVLEQQVEIALFNQQEENNFAYAEAVRAYYEEKNYEQAIEKFSEAIKNEKKQSKGKGSSENEVVAKSMYWQAEAYVKTQDIPKAIKIFESLAKTCRTHYLTLSAQRRAESLKAKHS